MGRKLRYTGVAVLALAAWVLLAGEAGWIGSGVSGTLFTPLLVGGAICFGVGALELLLSPLLRLFRRGRCVRCGAAIEKGQTYCLNHLRDTLDEYHERAHWRSR